MNHLSSYCHISTKEIVTDKGALLFDNTEGLEVNDFLKTVYKKLAIDYPKFYKMDSLSKAAFLGVELLKKENAALAEYADDEIALLFANSNASEDTDKKFVNSYAEEHAPSPSLFVYTLPSILMGELAIRNKWYGESLFVILQKFDAAFFADYCNMILLRNAKACICGWIEITEGKTEAFIFLAEKNGNENNTPLTKQTIEKIYKTIMKQSRPSKV
ncbi:MAG: hypothetical protein IAF38_18590 [Bacteroidia bacterium]|nr:hypothetical protein [Bacteroidia bacterium]